jgi:type II secretory pathway pseudopilin PulG
VAASSERDSGFTMLETLLSLGLISTMMAALAPFLVGWTVTADAQRDRQVAIQLAGEAVEQARAMRGGGLLAGRSRAAVQAQWAQAPATVRTAYATTMLCAWDKSLTDAAAEACDANAAAAGSAPGAQAPLPTVPVESSVAGVTYRQNWYVGQCWQSTAAFAPCDTIMGAGDVLLIRVVVAVTWPHQTCSGGLCVYHTTTLQSPADDPLFNVWVTS